MTISSACSEKTNFPEKQKGRFDAGWDVIRKQTYERQKKLGVIPPNTKPAAKPDDIKDWKNLSDKEKKLFSCRAEHLSAHGGQPGGLLRFALYLGQTGHKATADKIASQTKTIKTRRIKHESKQLRGYDARNALGHQYVGDDCGCG